MKHFVLVPVLALLPLGFCHAGDAAPRRSDSVVHDQAKQVKPLATQQERVFFFTDGKPGDVSITLRDVETSKEHVTRDGETLRFDKLFIPMESPVAKDAGKQS